MILDKRIKSIPSPEKSYEKTVQKKTPEIEKIKSPIFPSTLLSDQEKQ